MTRDLRQLKARGGDRFVISWQTGPTVYEDLLISTIAASSHVVTHCPITALNCSSHLEAITSTAGGGGQTLPSFLTIKANNKIC